LFPTVPWLAEKRSGRPGNLSRRSTIIRLSVFPTIVIRPQLFETKALQNMFHSQILNKVLVDRYMTSSSSRPSSALKGACGSPYQ
ncbi:MAG: hypothetical protein WC092_08675, partial [Anaerovoracaceae bacterium]